jgi:RNA polymerase sigma-70 factor (ECF subfamily)
MGNNVKSQHLLRVPDHDGSPSIAAAAEFADTVDLPTNPEILSREGFDAFARRVRPRLLRYYLGRRLRLEDAQDLAQEALLLHWGKRKASLSPHLAFLLGIARRLYFAFLRTRRQDALSLDELMETGAPEPDHSASAPIETDLPGTSPPIADLLAHAADLTPSQRRVLQLRYLERMSQRQVAEKLGLSRRSVETHERRGLAMLRRSTGRKPV